MSPPTPKAAPNPMNCEEIQDVLMAYMARELGRERSRLVREHIRRCPACRAEAVDVRHTMTALSVVAQRDDAGLRLTDERRARILWSAAHPLLDAVYRHHVLVSIAVTFLLLLVIGLYLRTVIVRENLPVEGIPVRIMPFDAPAPTPPATPVPPSG